jgi:4-carboxymuconolactone decarboxylase
MESDTAANTPAAHADERLPAVPPEHYTPDQAQAAAAFEAARRVPVFGPFEPMLHSPELMSLARAMGDYLRYRSAIGNTLSELAILVTAREWTQDFEWHVHYPIALRAGIRRDVADAIAEGRRPVGMNADEEIVYDFASELLQNGQVADATFARAKARFGTNGVVDLTGIVGYYSFLAMQLNVAQCGIPADGRKLPRMPR